MIRRIPGTSPALLAALCHLLHCCVCMAAPADEATLKSSYDRHRWFELRDSVAKGGAPVFYQGVVACAFNDSQGCERRLAVVTKSAKLDEVLEAHRHLASLYLTHGKYREALEQVDAVLALKADDSDAKGVRPLLAALRESPNQQTVWKRSGVLQLEESGLPFSIHGVPGTFWFDTGANFSVLSESEAKRFGLRVRSVGAKVSVSTGERVDFRITVADKLTIGPVVLKNVAFLVFPDDQPPFKDGAPGSRGLIGIPVLLAFESFAWADRKFEIGPKSATAHSPRANLCFDGNTPAVQLQFENQDLIFVLDTGATNTDIFPPFAQAFPELVRNATKTDAYKLEAVGSVRSMSVATLESVRLTVGGFPVVLKPANVLLAPTGETSKFFEGNLGIDLLQQAHRTTFDFRAMTLTLQ